MATIFDLTENTAPDGTDRLYITDGTNDEGVQIANLLKGSGAEVPAAKITGTITNAQVGLTGSIVGTTDTQTLTNKTIDTASNTITVAASDIASGTLVHERGGLEADVSAYDGLIRISGGSTSNLKSNFSASAAPAVTDDSASGYVVGSRWIDTTNDKEYVCLDNTATAAVWTETTGGGGGGGGGGSMFLTPAFFLVSGSPSYVTTDKTSWTGDASDTAYFYGKSNGTTDVIIMMGSLPSNFSSIDSADLLISSNSTTEPEILIMARMQAEGEALGTGGTDSTTTTSSWYTHGSAYLIERHSITGLLSSAAADDHIVIAVRFNSGSNEITVLGCTIEWS